VNSFRLGKVRHFFAIRHFFFMRGHLAIGRQAGPLFRTKTDQNAMKTLLNLEELTQLGFAIFLFTLLPFAWWWFPALLLLPDLGMLGYLVNPRLGAATYNLFHHKGLAVLIGVLGYFTAAPYLMLAGIILYGHASMDRLMGYGLKYPDSFKHTHLGRLNEGRRTDAPPSISVSATNYAN